MWKFYDFDWPEPLNGMSSLILTFTESHCKWRWLVGAKKKFVWNYRLFWEYRKKYFQFAKLDNWCWKNIIRPSFQLLKHLLSAPNYYFFAVSFYFFEEFFPILCHIYLHLFFTCNILSILLSISFTCIYR